MSYESPMAFGVAVSDASNQAEEARAQAAHAQKMQHYQDMMARHRQDEAAHRGRLLAGMETRANDAE